MAWGLLDSTSMSAPCDPARSSFTAQGQARKHLEVCADAGRLRTTAATPTLIGTCSMIDSVGTPFNARRARPPVRAGRFCDESETFGGSGRSLRGEGVG